MAYYTGTITGMTGDATTANAPSFSPSSATNSTSSVSVSASELGGIDSSWTYTFTDSGGTEAATLTVSQTGLREEFLTLDAGQLIESGSLLFAVLK